MRNAFTKETNNFKFASLFTKHNALFLIAMAVMIFFVSISDTNDYFKAFWLIFIPILFFASLFYVPLFFVYLIRQKTHGDIKNVKTFFRIVNWIVIILLLLCFLLQVAVTFHASFSIFYTYVFPKRGLLGGLWILIKLPLSGYRTSIEYGLLDDLEQILYFTPFVIVPWLLYKVNKLNKIAKTN